QKNFLKKNYNEKIEKITEGYEKRIDILMSQNKELRMKMENTIREVMLQSQAEVERQKDSMKAAMNSEMEAQNQVTKNREDELRSQIKDIHKNYSEKMTELRLDNQRKLKEMRLKVDQELTNSAKKFDEIIAQN